MDQRSGLTVVGQIAGDDNSLLPLDIYVPDVIVWDVSWETSNAVNSLGLLPEDAPPVLALAVTSDQAAQARAAGAQALLSGMPLRRPWPRPPWRLATGCR